MSKRTHARVVLADYKERKADEGAIDIVLSDGSTFRIPPPELWPDEVSARIIAERAGGASYGLGEMARGIVGDAEFDRFAADGGTSTLFHSILKDEHDLDSGESSAS